LSRRTFNCYVAATTPPFLGLSSDDLAAANLSPKRFVQPLSPLSFFPSSPESNPCPFSPFPSRNSRRWPSFNGSSDPPFRSRTLKESPPLPSSFFPIPVRRPLRRNPSLVSEEALQEFLQAPQTIQKAKAHERLIIFFSPFLSPLVEIAIGEQPPSF